MEQTKRMCLVALALVTFLLAAVALVVVAAEQKCNMDKIEVAYKCPECGKLYDSAGNCAACSEEERPVALKVVKVCVKTGYVCEQCKKDSLKPGACPSCGKQLTAKTVKSEIVYKCPKCGAVSEASGNCRTCKGDGGAPVALQMTCKDSGIFPHVTR